MKRIFILFFCAISIAATSHETMYEALEKAAKDVLIKADGCGELTVKRIERFPSSESSVVRNSLTINFDACNHRGALVSWSAPTERVDGDKTPIIIDNFELAVSCPDYIEVFKLSGNIFKQSIPKASGECTFVFFVTDSFGLTSEPVVIVKRY